MIRKLSRTGSSVWLECLPVTQEVAGSSPVRSAIVRCIWYGDIKTKHHISGRNCVNASCAYHANNF